MIQESNTVRVCFVTLGCAKNEVDSAHMRARVENAGFVIEDDPCLADAIIVNTCSFIQAATEESLEMIFDMADFSRENPKETKLIVSGCMPSRYGSELAQELPEVAQFVPCDKEDDIVAILIETLGIDPLEVPIQSAGSNAPLPLPNQVSTYVKISDGCDRYCSYCTIPFIRGKYQSFSGDAIEEEVRVQVDNGVREIVLIAQDTGRWGDDFEEPSTLSTLLESLARRFPTTWFRVMYIQPEGITDSLLDVVSRFDNICSYFDIPIQHTSKDILTAMNRRGSVDEIKELVFRIRKVVPDAVIRTTLIAGFPGETEEDFEALCDFIETADFDYVGVFPYSQEEGTRAAHMDNQIDEQTKIERAQILRDIADSIGFDRVSQRRGNTYEVLVLGQDEDGQLYGRTQQQAPDVDGVTFLTAGNVGEIYRVVISDTLLYEMEGE